MTSHMLPPGFKHLFQDRAYIESLAGSSFYVSVGNAGALGRRLFFGPLCVEYYTCDQEPELTAWRGLRFVIWTRVTRTDVPKKWFQISKESGREVCAYIPINDTDTYYKKWSDTFKTYYYRFAKQTSYHIEEIACDEFCTQYRKHAKTGMIISQTLQQMKKLSHAEQKIIHFYVLKNSEHGDLVAGVAGVDCLSVDQSFYITAFTRKDIAPKEAGLWLCNHWMKESSRRGILYANFGNIWTPGQPTAWKGFSDFKKKFNPNLIMLKPELIRITFSFFK